MMNISHCRETTNGRRIVVAEKGKKATFLNDAQESFVRTRYDGCVPAEGLKADYIVSKANLGCIIVELKGRGIDHAIKQITETAEFWLQHGFCCGRIAGLIVSVGIPTSSTTLQRAKNAFMKKFKGPLRVVSGNREFNFEAILF